MESKQKEPRFHGITTEQSSKKMKGIKGKNTKIEMVLRKALWKKGYRYRKNYEKIPGRPDIAMPQYKIAIFCDGEFFHGKDWEVLRPRLEKGSNPEYWIKKIERNRIRDKEKDAQLSYLGWTVIHFWGKDIIKNTDECIKVIEEAIFDNAMNEDDD